MIFQFLIPTYNDYQWIDVTVASIYDQICDDCKYYVTIMDFGSTDGTYEKILRYGYSDLGIYKSNYTFSSRRSMIAEMYRLLEVVNKYRCVDYYVILYPGDTISPDYLEKCEKQIAEHDVDIGCVICETSIQSIDDKLIRQKTLYENSFVIPKHEGIEEFLKGLSFNHQIQCMVKEISDENVRFTSIRNEQRWWNKAFFGNEFNNVLYIKDVLATQRQIMYEDELEEILLRWEAIISYYRFNDNNTNFTKQSLVDNYLQTVALYALWRSNLYTNINSKVSEDCFLISKVIWPDIVNTQEYFETRNIVMGL